MGGSVRGSVTMYSYLIPLFAAIVLLAVVTSMGGSGLTGRRESTAAGGGGGGGGKASMLLSKTGETAEGDVRKGKDETPAAAAAASASASGSKSGGKSVTDGTAETGAHSDGYCYLKDGGPVLMGADVVEYHYLQPLSPAVLGTPVYTSLLNGYTFYFSSEDNKRLFDLDPWKYAPRWGGFCSWGVAEEDFWSGKNISAEADINYWYISDDDDDVGKGRLQFFRSQLPMSRYMANVEYWSKEGDKHWDDWFGSDGGGGDGGGGTEDYVFNTLCMCQLANDGEACNDG